MSEEQMKVFETPVQGCRHKWQDIVFITGREPHTRGQVLHCLGCGTVFDVISYGPKESAS